MPRALAVETSGRVGSVALVDNGRVVAVDAFPHGLQHAAHIITRIQALCDQVSWKPTDFQEIYVSIGPGSFTGLRIGVTLAKTLAFAIGAKVVAVPAARGLAESAPPEATELLIVLDAKRDQIFTARFKRRSSSEPWQEVEPPHLDDLASALSRAARPVWLLGDGIPQHRKFIPADDQIHETPEEGWRPRAEVIAELGFAAARQGIFVEPEQLVPLYIRKPEAEEVWEKKHALSPSFPPPVCPGEG
jgi:tRNA threonylcarbamoyladenosine biosynthesis protein TsaB